MLLLTWHGTILRVEQTTSRLSHAAPVPVRAVASDFRVGLTLPLAGPVPVPGEMEAVPGERSGTLHLRRGDRYLAVEPDAPYPACDRDAAGPWETLLALPEAQAALLRRLLQGAWTVAETGARLAPGDIRLGEGFALQAGERQIDLASVRPQAEADGAVRLDTPAGRLTLSPLAFDAPEPEWLLCPAPPGHRAREVATVAALHAEPGTRLTLPSPPERVHLPLTAHRQDADWLYRNPWRGQAPLFGKQHFQSQAVHEADRYVLLERSVEGMIFGPHGVSNEQGYLGNLTGKMPPNLAREADQTFIAAAALRAAPRLHGPHAVFYGGNLSNYYHWLIDAMVPLSLLAPLLPPATTLLLPGTLAELRAHRNGRFDHIEMLEAFGFGDLPRVEVDARVCLVEDVWWPDRCFIEQVSGADLDTARRRALDRLPPAGAATRLVYIRRTTTRRVANGPAVEAFMRQIGFEIHAMEDLTVAGQIDLFRHAAFVIGVHGAALANLVFCPPGTKVIELAPDTGFRPFFSVISGKLGLVHGIIPCPTHNDNFFGGLKVPLDRLRALHRMLERRL
jgi:hypothetical protein